MNIWSVPPNPAGQTPRAALFLDRDGVIIADENYLADPEKVRLLPGVAEALLRAQRAGFLLIGVSNQSGIGRGYFSEAEFDAVMVRLQEHLAAAGVTFDSFHYCPHGPDDGCRCRKPGPGMFEEACALLPVDPARTWMIGDKASDVAFGRGLGLGAVLVRTGYGSEQEDAVRRRWAGDEAVLVAADLPAALDMILDLDRGRG